MPTTSGVIASAAAMVAAAVMPIAQMLARSAPNSRLTVGIRQRSRPTAPTPNTA